MAHTQTLVKFNLVTLRGGSDSQHINTSRVLKENCPADGWPYFSTNCNHFKTPPNIIRTYVLTNKHEDCTINETSRMLSRNTALHCHAPCGHAFQRTGAKINNVLTKCHADWT
ncbi:hypothetical protein DPMN_028563 [Dreissena polymorpha]|uniref:Uncharacterized protein n=1 Tax=Dreissena polymorpha TaxID=45954 RepID=A0A9D4LVN1_DREPO|nr:hypothetical protein DPMN_028563 [Dreissena polymorpha]